MSRLTVHGDDEICFNYNGNPLPVGCMQAHQVQGVLNCLASYEDAMYNGILPRLPCKPGTFVWCITGKNSRVHPIIVQGCIRQFEVRDDGVFAKIYPVFESAKIWKGGHFSVKSFGDIVFLSRKAAEKALTAAPSSAASPDTPASAPD